MNSKHLFLVLSVFSLVSIAHGEREVFAPTKLAPVAEAGTIRFDNGTAAAPSMTFKSDTDTGVFRATDNTLGVTTGGTERMRITSAGNVMVGNGEVAASVANGNIRATGGSGTNIAGADLVLHGGQSTGNVIGGAIRLFAAPPGVSGSAVNASVERWRVKGSGQVRYVPLAAAPTVNVEDGDVYYNSTTNKLQVRAAGVWVDLH